MNLKIFNDSEGTTNTTASKIQVIDHKCKQILLALRPKQLYKNILVKYIYSYSTAL